MLYKSLIWSSFLPLGSLWEESVPSRFPPLFMIWVGLKITGNRSMKGWENFKIQRKDYQERIDNSVVVIRLYNQNSCIPFANFIIINLPSRCTEDVRVGLWYHPVTPRPHGYGDATVTYIRRFEILSYIYAKYHYRRESEYETTRCIIHSKKWV